MKWLEFMFISITGLNLVYTLHASITQLLKENNAAFLNKSSYIQLIPRDFQDHIGFSFRTCSPGTLFAQISEKFKVSLDISENGLLLLATLINQKFESKITGQFLDNMWHRVHLNSKLGNVTLTLDDHHETVANGSHNSELLNAEGFLLDMTAPLKIGGTFFGCILEDADFPLNGSTTEVSNVEWGPCPLPLGTCAQCKKGYNMCSGNGKCEDDVCVCAQGFVGVYPNCTEIVSCLDTPCMNSGTCTQNIASYNCTCPAGFTGKLCEHKIKECQSNPCQNNATCVDSTDLSNKYTCTCMTGFTGSHCELDIDECKQNICKHGHCVNSYGTYQCFCIPGYTGDFCDIDVDECLSEPCMNGATCINGQNRFICKCPPGFTGKDCAINVDECSPNPCLHGSTCVDGNNSYTCLCSSGYNGVRCEVNIDDCKTLPCLHNGICLDGIDSYTCDCTDTGFYGNNCEINIDDCGSNPCVNNGTCQDLIKDYQCSCYPGYTGKNCQEDINECESNPCQYGSTCLQRSDQSLYNRFDASNSTVPASFSREFSFANASGYECVCVPGVTGNNCEIDIKECDSNPCHHGGCREEIGGYTCECEDGYNGTHCETEIDECATKPCIFGTCIDKLANYYCECNSKYGGKNCSVELIGCNRESACQNNGSCKPYLIGETEHRFNCTCPSGFHGATCEKVTTMSLNGEAYVVVNTTREEGYDVSFRFKTTLPSGLLALGKGSTFYILELMNGRLNLHSSLLNKWEGVFIGSGLNDSNWQKVFVAINSSHVVLAANEEQTIYPISFNEGGSSNWTSFPTTFVGGTVTNLRHLAHGPPVFIGCTENIVINGQWVIPGEPINNVLVEKQNVEVGCLRKDQCKEDSCNGVGQCTDLWKNFTCSCQRPYFGERCQYNVTAATFGHENITKSLVTVSISNVARKAIRNIVDISMFIRTRQAKGAIFYLGSLPGSVMLNEETHIAAELVDGELLVRIHFHNTTESYTVGGVKLNDGRNHLIQVIRNVTLVQVKINGTEYFRKTIGSSASLDAQVLYLGGYPVQDNENESLPTEIMVAEVSKNKDSTSIKVDPPVSSSSSPSLASSRFIRQTADIFDNIPHFKGVIQDVQVSNGSLKMTIDIFPQKALGVQKLFGNVSFDPNTVLEGVLSDNACASNPCFNGAECSVTWNDFVCSCPNGYKGKQCQDMEFCKLKECPSKSECRNLPNGYECVTNITMHGASSNTSLQYEFVQNDKLATVTSNTNSLEIMYRSRTGGTLLYLFSQPDAYPDKHLYFFIFVFNDKVTVAWKLDGASKETFHRIEKEPLDGEWTSIIIKIESNKIFVSFSGVENESGQYFSSNNFSSAAWYNLITSGKIYVGGTDNNIEDALFSRKNSYQLESEAGNSVDGFTDIIYRDSSVLHSLSKQNPTGTFYKGCIGEIRINGILLPYFTENQLNYNTAYKTQSYFTLLSTKVDDIYFGCYLCFPSDCQNNGTCTNATESYSCDCQTGFDGEDCSHDIDECEENKCQHGATCINGVGNYTCECTVGWSGWLCDTDVDECASQPCQNNGSCSDHLGYYKCTCTDEYVGKNCEQIRQVTCENKPCKHGANCFDKPNKNTGDNFTCSCLDGFIGTYCDETFCSATPCQNGGSCTISQKKEPICQCQEGFQGMYCEININDCQLGRDGTPPCLHNGRCIDGIASYSCNCTGTGFTGARCEIDIDECVETPNICGEHGVCKNKAGSYKCECEPNVCGYHCDLYDPCMSSPCQNGGSCQERCTFEPDYECTCIAHFIGKNCTEVQLYSVDRVMDIALIVGPIAFLLILAVVASLVMFLMMARNKRATRGTYSPSSQEYCNPRVELDNVMKPPPEERLI